MSGCLNRTLCDLQNNQMSPKQPRKKDLFKRTREENKKTGIFAIGKRGDMKVYREVFRRLESGT